MQAMNIYAQYFEIEKGKYSIWGNMQNQCSDGWREGSYVLTDNGFNF